MTDDDSGDFEGTDDNVLTLAGDAEANARARRALAHYFSGDVEKIRAAFDEYDGTYESFEIYVRRELEEHVPPYMLWLVDKWTDLAGIANDWLIRGRNWLLADGDEAVHVFLSNRPMADIDEREVDVAEEPSELEPAFDGTDNAEK